MNTAKNFIEHVLADKGVQEVADCSEPIKDVNVDEFKEVYIGLSKTEKYLLKTRINRQIMAQKYSSSPEVRKRVSRLEELYNVMVTTK